MDTDLELLTGWGQVKEAGKEDTHHLEGSNIWKCGWEKAQEGMDNEELDELTDTLKIKKLMQTASKTYQYCNSELAVHCMDLIL